MLETHQIQLAFIDWRSGSYNWESWRMGFLNICKPISKSSTAKRIDKVFLIMFPSLWFKKKNDGWMTALRCSVGAECACLCALCLRIIFIISSPESHVIYWLSWKNIFIADLFMPKVFSCDVPGALLRVGRSDTSPCVFPPPEGRWHPGGHGWQQRYQALSLRAGYVWGTWFDRWYIQIPVIMSHV